MEDSLQEQIIVEEVSKLVEAMKELQESASSFISRSTGEEQSLRQRVISLDSDLKKIHSSLASSAGTGTLDQKVAEQLDEELHKARCILSDGDGASYLPNKSHGRFLKMFLGPINVRASRKDVRLKVKNEYNSYKDRTSFLFLLFPSVLLILRSWVWEGCLPALPVQLFQAWLLFLYTSLALRENVLRVNGSDIRAWWICHHYCAMIMVLVSLTWEVDSEMQSSVQLLLAWAVMQGVAMLLQNRYQRQRLYTRIALGKAKRMDVVWGEAAGVEGQLLLLCPVLFILQGFEAYIGLSLLRTALVSVFSEWQVAICGILLVVMAVGNFVNTVQTLISKSRFKAKMRKSKKQEKLVLSESGIGKDREKNK